MSPSTNELMSGPAPETEAQIDAQAIEKELKLRATPTTEEAARFSAESVGKFNPLEEPEVAYVPDAERPDDEVIAEDEPTPDVVIDTVVDEAEETDEAELSPEQITVNGRRIKAALHVIDAAERGDMGHLPAGAHIPTEIQNEYDIVGEPGDYKVKTPEGEVVSPSDIAPGADEALAVVHQQVLNPVLESKSDQAAR